MPYYDGTAKEFFFFWGGGGRIRLNEEIDFRRDVKLREVREEN